MLWPSVISAASGLLGTLIGAGVTLRGERGRREADARLEAQRIARLDAAERRDLRAVARLEIARLMISGSPLNTAIADQDWRLGAAVQLESLTEQDRRTLARGISSTAYLTLVKANAGLATFALQQEIAKQGVTDHGQPPKFTDEVLDQLRATLNDVNDAVDLLTPYMAELPVGVSYDEALERVKKMRLGEQQTES